MTLILSISLLLSLIAYVGVYRLWRAEKKNHQKTFDMYYDKSQALCHPCNDWYITEDITGDIIVERKCEGNPTVYIVTAKIYNCEYRYATDEERAYALRCAEELVEKLNETI